MLRLVRNRLSVDTSLHFSTGKDTWETPDDLYDRLNNTYRFILDAAADSTNHKCARYFGPGGEQEDVLTATWPLTEGNIWLNPPYTRGLQAKFVRKAWSEHLRVSYGTIVCLLPARTDTRLFHEVIQPYGRIEFLKGRLRFKGAKAPAPFPSMLVVF